MIRAVESKSVVIGRFQSRPDDLIDKLESIGTVVLERRASDSDYLIVAVTEPNAKGMTLGYISSRADKTYDPMNIEIRGFDRDDNPFAAEEFP